MGVPEPRPTLPPAFCNPHLRPSCPSSTSCDILLNGVTIHTVAHSSRFSYCFSVHPRCREPVDFPSGCCCLCRSLLPRPGFWMTVRATLLFLTLPSSLHTAAEWLCQNMARRAVPLLKDLQTHGQIPHRELPGSSPPKQGLPFSLALLSHQALPPSISL